MFTPEPGPGPGAGLYPAFSVLDPLARLLLSITDKEIRQRRSGQAVEPPPAVQSQEWVEESKTYNPDGTITVKFLLPAVQLQLVHAAGPDATNAAPPATPNGTDAGPTPRPRGRRAPR